MSQFKQQRRPSNTSKTNSQPNQEPTTDEHTRILRRGLNHSTDKRQAGSGQHAHPPTKSVGCRGRNEGTDEAAHEDDGSHESESGVSGVIHIYPDIRSGKERKEE